MLRALPGDGASHSARALFINFEFYVLWRASTSVRDKARGWFGMMPPIGESSTLFLGWW